ncbi:MAG: exodeoxyribonuclease VII small subunit [Betaproteobacteria bacterium]|nr:exodeoxyribonuclease VII small subunit [Betaproteobacteria bacterium]
MAKSAAKAGTDEAPASFEAALEELEELVGRLETGELPLEQALAAHRRGLALAKYCSEKLARAEAEVKILEGELLKTLAVDDAGDDTAK